MAVHPPLLGTMDRVRPATPKRAWQAIALVLVLGAVVLFVITRRPAVPRVDRSALVIAEVTRGEFVHEISAAGALVAEQPRLIAAPAAGRVDRIDIEAGDALRRGDVILRLSNRETMRQLLEVEQQLAVAQADFADLSATLQARSLESEKTLRRTKYEKQDAARQAEASAQLARDGLISELEHVRRREAAQEVAERVVTESERHAALNRSASAQLDAGRNRLERLRALHAFHRDLVESLVVRAPADTTAREILVQEGEWVTEGQRLVRLVEPGRLKAVLQLPEATASEVRAGQKVVMNARGTALRGVVHRLATSVEGGTVAAEVRLEGALPPSARPDLSVEGRVEISRIGDAISVARATNAMPRAATHLYKLDERGRTARRTEIRFGEATVDRIVVVSGAAPGDRLVIAGSNEQKEPVIRLD